MRSLSILLAALFLFLSSCSDSESAGATGVGNPTEVAVLGVTDSVQSQGGFENVDSRTRSAVVTEEIKDINRVFTLDSLTLIVDKFSWQIDTTSFSGDFHESLDLVGEELFYYGPVTFDILNNTSSITDIYLPTAGYKKIRMYLDSEEDKKATIIMSGTYQNASNVSVPFTFRMPFSFTIQFKQKGAPYYWDTSSENRVDFMLKLNEWFADQDILSLLSIDAESVDEAILEVDDFSKIKDNKISNNIRKSGVLSIYEK